MWKYLVIAVNLFVCPIVAVPTQNDIAKSFQNAVHHQNLQTILISIEQRLRNLDSIYSMHLSPTLEEKFEQYQRKLESIDIKIIRLESLMMLNLDKISENISTKNFKDDIAKTNLMKKMDATYEGISHRLSYMDRKFETNTNKIQSKLETTLTLFEKIDEGFTRRDEDIEMELSDAITAIEDLKTSCQLMEENIVNNTNENFEVSLKEQMDLIKSFSDKSIDALRILYENTTKDFDGFSNKIGEGIEAIRETNISLKNFQTDLKRDFNEYAVKVAEMNSENWKAGTVLQKKQTVLENILNSTKTEVQNGIRAVMLQIGKISNKDQLPQADQAQIEKLREKMDSNFEKVFSAQNLFMDSCYRLQMDESQIESKISDILEKLIETFEKKTAIEIKDIKNLEKIIKSHDSHITKNLYQANTNIITIYERMSKDHGQFEADLRQVTDHLSALFSLVQDTLADENGSLSRKNVNILLRDLNEMETKITSLNKQGETLTNSVEEIKRIVESLNDINSTRVINDYFKNISQTIAEMETKINDAYLYYHFNRTKIDAINQELTQQLKDFMGAINLKKHSTVAETAITQIPPDDSGRNETKLGPISNQTSREKIDKLITEIFGIKAQSNDSNEASQDTQNGVSRSGNCGSSDLIDIIDVRANFDCETQQDTTTETREPSESYEKVSDTEQTPVKLNDSAEYDFDLNNWHQVTV